MGGQDLLLHIGAHPQDAFLDVAHLHVEALTDTHGVSVRLGLEAFADAVGVSVRLRFDRHVNVDGWPGGDVGFDVWDAGRFVRGLHGRLLVLLGAHPNRPEM